MITVNSIGASVRASFKMVLLHLVNFIFLEVLYVIRYIAENDTWVKQNKIYLLQILIANKCFYTYMSFVLYYLVYRFDKNMNLGTMVFKEAQSDQIDEKGLSEKQRLRKNYWRWLMNTLVLE